ncbi:PucR family transcriptional regulator [Enemella dayhoffiae]|uniref:PucR family transcriptional regulator n=1 Tax=Enemella dayhoffiae TaxID=2016507 RepID=A0A255GPK3_9ACTN|nr:PucR family transcriptional regulator [Enemella dayhoffiae]
MATAAAAEMEQRHAWFSALGAEHRSWVGVVARAGIDGFIEWFGDPDSASSGLEVFATAPRALARHISLHQTVELVRTTIEVVESKLQELLPRGDRPVAQLAIIQYSREIAFAAAEVYARAAETRGAWDARLEALVVDAVVRGEADETVLSRASTMGWTATSAVAVAVGAAPGNDDPRLGEDLRRTAARSDVDLLSAIQGDRLVLVLGGRPMAEVESGLTLTGRLLDFFGPGPVVLGPSVDHLVDASASARSALSGLRAAAAWQEAPRPVSAVDLLPERALNGDGHARRALAHEVFGPLAEAGGGLLETLVAFLDAGTSIEGTARALFVHANTVRYRLRRITEVSGYNPADPRDAYVLRMALTLGRLLGPGTRDQESR